MTDKTSPSLFVRVDGTDAAAMKTIPELQPLLARYIEIRTNAGDSADAITSARDRYCTSDDIEIDDNPAVSIAENGTWVNAWLWVPMPDEDEAEEDDEESDHEPS